MAGQADGKARRASWHAGVRGGVPPSDLIRAQLELECIGVDDEGLLHRIPGDHPDDIHRAFLVRHLEATELFIRRDVDATVIRKLRRLSTDRLWCDPAELARLLYGSAVVPEGSWSGSAYYFADAYPEDAEAYPEGSFALATTGEGKHVVSVDGTEVSWAWSSRSNDRCAELATETDEAHRRQGLATRVCGAWANEQLSRGRIPFYSHLSGNVASAALAEKLGVTHFMDCVSYP